MGLLEGYGSSDEEPCHAPKKRIVAYGKLPVSRPLSSGRESRRTEPELEPDAGELEKQAAAAAAQEARRSEERLGSDSSSEEENPEEANLAEQTASWLPAPKSRAAEEVEIDFSASKPREKPRAAAAATAWLVKAASVPEVEEPETELPSSILKHPMLRELRDPMKHIQANSLTDPDWEMNSLLSGQPGFHRGSKVADNASMYDAERWQQTTFANPSRTQKRKHHINWLASTAIEQEAELLDRAAGTSIIKAQTAARYGW